MDVREVVYPFYMVSKLFGYSFFDLPRGRRSDGDEGQTRPAVTCRRPSLPKVLQYAAYLSIVCFNLYFNITQNILFAGTFAEDNFSTVTGRRLSTGLFTSTGVMILFSMLHGFLFRQEVRMIVDKFIKFDRIFEGHFSGLDHVHHRRVVMGYLAISLMIVLTLVPFTLAMLDGLAYNMPDTVQFLLFGYVATLNYSILQSHTILSVSAVFVRLNAINKVLRAVLENDKDGKTEQLDRSPKRNVCGNVVRVQQCRILHDTLNDIVELINLCFTFHAMWCSLSCFGFSLMSFYSDYELLMRQERSCITVCVNFVWNFFYITYSTGIVWVASRTRTEANHTTALVHKIINANLQESVLLIDEVERLGRKGVNTERFFWVMAVKTVGVVGGQGYSCERFLAYSSYPNWWKPFSIPSTKILCIHLLTAFSPGPPIQLRIFSQQLGHRIPVVSCGLFNFDWSLYYSVSGWLEVSEQKPFPVVVLLNIALYFPGDRCLCHVFSDSNPVQLHQLQQGGLTGIL